MNSAKYLQWISAIVLLAAALAHTQAAGQSSDSRKAQDGATKPSADSRKSPDVALEAPIAGVIPLGVTRIETDLITPGLRATKLLDQAVYNDKGERIGDIKDLVVSTDGKLTAAVVEVGGFLGIRSHRVAIPVRQFAAMYPKVTLPGATKEALKGLPRFVPA